jgi:hypothetical protein
MASADIIVILDPSAFTVHLSEHQSDSAIEIAFLGTEAAQNFA